MIIDFSTLREGTTVAIETPPNKGDPYTITVFDSASMAVYVDGFDFHDQEVLTQILAELDYQPL